ncbi:RagB/SusD family nutrient uptake outer membrane protein [Chitinophaga sp. XS-30]|uniref:RagB/SusD family nutrient uptake outer membrane protein n=1 Tax=Chitinophaga sp. XS-30 TaxID=2604421 RepID=UPI001AEFEDA9|nr:RagB/SusD family nutrient uptake outer membrane protein [Chitinophaga sp. XS-30]
MNAIYKTLTMLLLLSVLGTSCKNRLDLQPEQSLSEDETFSSKSTTLSALLGVYSRSQMLEVFGALPQVIDDYMADNVEFRGSFPTLQQLNNFEGTSDNSSTRDIWRFSYEVILAANKVIARVPGVSDATFTDQEKAQYIAEAKFVRAYVYFQLVNQFAQPYQVSQGSNLGVPLILNDFTGTVEFPGRSTVQQVHAQIQKDLEEALPDLLNNFDAPVFTRGRATKGAANALLSRFHLYRGEWTQAADYADDVLDNTALYTLAPNYDFYDGNTPEDIFSIQMSATDNSRTGSGGWSSYYRPTNASGRGDCPFSANLIAAFEAEPGDERFALSDMGTAVGAVQRRFTLKFPDASTNADNSPLIRVTEMYLNKAEALAQRDGINLTSIGLINDLRGRANLGDWTLLTFATKQAFIDGILNERRKELCFEGHRRMDLLRNGKPLRTTGAGAGISDPGDDFVILPIPQREIDVNTGLQGQQNSGYE